MGIFAQAADDLENEKIGWCKRSYHLSDGRSVSCCLAGALQRAAGATWIDETNEVHIGPHEAWVKANKAVDALSLLIQDDLYDEEADPEERYKGIGDRNEEPVSTFLSMNFTSFEQEETCHEARVQVAFDGHLTNFNDSLYRTKESVIRVLRRAAVHHPDL